MVNSQILHTASVLGKLECKDYFSTTDIALTTNRDEHNLAMEQMAPVVLITLLLFKLIENLVSVLLAAHSAKLRCKLVQLPRAFSQTKIDFSDSLIDLLHFVICIFVELLQNLQYLRPSAAQIPAQKQNANIAK